MSTKAMGRKEDFAARSDTLEDLNTETSGCSDMPITWMTIYVVSRLDSYVIQQALAEVVE
jgi:hypothetical protein